VFSSLVCGRRLQMLAIAKVLKSLSLASEKNRSSSSAMWFKVPQ